MLQSSETLAAMQWRYATKVFDPQKKISAETWADLEKGLVLAPSSFGMQPWKFLVIQNPELRAQLLPVSWNQKQVVDCSHFVVFLAKKEITVSDVDRLIHRVVEIRGGTPNELMGYSKMLMANLVQGDAPQKIPTWASRQCYLALGQLLTLAALLKIDACPMEGFEQEKYDEILGLNNTGYTAVVACPLGYRSGNDRYAELPKVRYADQEIIEYR